MKSKIHSASDLQKICHTLTSQNKRMVFTNGCFDILHVGHVRYLEAARKLGDALVVAINSDASVRALKGPQRPINTEADRAEVLSALESVDYVVIFDDKRVNHLLEIIRPSVYAKGGDYTPDTLAPSEKTALEAISAEIHILPLIPGKSTTSTLSRIQAHPSA